MKKSQVKTEESPDYSSTPKPEYSGPELIQLALEYIESQTKVKGEEFSDADTSKSYFKLRLSLLEHEEFHVAFLNNKHCLIECQTMFRGTIDQASVYPREVVKEALKLNAAAVILAHNHPSGASYPSQADKDITLKLKSALSLVDIRTLDHIIIGNIAYSFADNGLI